MVQELYLISRKYAANYVRTSALLFVALALVISSTATHAAGRVFSDDFESGTVAKWSADNSRDMCKAVKTAVDGVGPQAGVFQLECNWNGIVTWDDPAAQSTVVLSSWSYSREFLIRFWVRFAADVDHTNGTKAFKLASDSGVNDWIFTGAMDQSGETMVSFFPSIAGAQGPTFWGDGQPFGDGKWHKVEIYVKNNSAGAKDGVFRVWQDGKVKQELVNVATTSGNDHWYPMYLMSNWSSNPGWEHDANNHVYWDSVEIYSDTGTGASGQMSDASITNSSGGATTSNPVPDPPTNVTVN